MDNNDKESQQDKRSRARQGKTQQEIYDEIKRMSEQADKKGPGKQSKLFGDEDLGSEDIGYDESLVNDVANPDLSHDLYYALWNFMKLKLPKGKENEPGRRFIYDEVNLFLNRGKHVNAKGKRGSDSRMALISPHLQPAFATVIDWMKRGAVPFDLYTAFRTKNEDLGYHKEKREKPIDVDYTDVTFDDRLKGLLSVPPPRKDKQDEE